MRRITKIKTMTWISFILGVTGAYGIWLLWQKVSELLGTGWLTFSIVWGIVILGVATGALSIKKITKRIKL